MDTIVNGNPAFLLDGKPFIPLVADTSDSENGAPPQQTFEPFRFAPTMLKKQMTPHQRIEHGFATFDGEM
jgi:hypothetical protein